MTVKELLKFGKDQLFGRDTGIMDTEVILSYVTGFSREELLAFDDRSVENDLVSLFKVYIERVLKGEPVAYIINSKEFFGLNYFVDNRVLIPRPETEFIVEAVLKYLEIASKDKKSFKCLDVGTGSGTIPVAILNSVFAKLDGDYDISFDAVDVSLDALDVAMVNVEQYSLSNNIHLFQSDLLDFADDCESFDVITANLPYIGEVKHRYVSDDAVKFEPNIALFGGEGGLVLYKKMFQQISDKEIFFNLLIGEFGFGQLEDMEKLLTTFFDQRWTILKDHSGVERVFIVN